ncbi:MAG TPA: ABC transporter substrate-binding protein [Verrucomicrobiales bacterium]|jgi:branched-chain amino acid transport system substrate-binding protein|nr:ABC transporter substrate-binding protein [Verrucomicrobiales bacterium]
MKRNLFLRSSFSLLAAVCVGTSGCSKKTSDTVKIGEFASITGKEATFGTSSHEGTKMAIDELNDAGGVLDKKLELVYEDNQSKEGQSSTAVNKLISKDNVVAVLGEVASGRSKEAAPICQSNKVPMVSPASTNPDVTQKGDYIFRVCFTDILQGKVLAAFAMKNLKADNVAVLTDVKSEYSKGLAKYFKQAYTGMGGKIAVELDYNGGEKDFKGQLTTIKGAGVKAVFIPGYYSEAALLCIQAKQLGITVPLFGGDGWESPDLTGVGKDAVDGNYFSTHSSVDSPDPAMKTFVAAYQKKYDGKTPDAMAMLGYDSAKILVDAIKRAGSTDGDKIRKALSETKDFPGVTGKITIDADRNATKPMVILQVVGGKLKLVETINP